MSALLFLFFTFLMADTSVAHTAAAPPVVIEYSAPEGAASDEAYRFTELARGQRVFTVATGTPLRVLEPLDRARQGNRVDQRYLVAHEDGRQSRVFGGDL